MRPGVKSARITATALRQHRLILRKLGPTPARALAAMKDYGLTDTEIARYYGVTPSTLRRIEIVLETTSGRVPGNR